MDQETPIRQDERMMAGVAHGSILLGIFSNGIGGILTTLVIWMTQKEKSAYVARQAMQALVYQVLSTVVTFVVWGCWGMLYMVMIFVPLIANPAAFEQSAPPPSIWFGLILMVFPLAIWGLTVLYGLWGAVQSWRGVDFSYTIVGKWLKERE